ncbi:MAG: substrate-binding domain-containing protein, partial [Planctomycetota bacterium]
ASLQFARYLTARDRGQTHFEAFTYDTIKDADVWSDHPEVLLMAGAMLKPGIEDVIATFEKREGVTIKPVYNGCGILVAQMKTGTLPEAYFSCDTSFMTDVEHHFNPSVDVSKNPMMLVVPTGNPRSIKTLYDLTTPGLKIGLAHPQNSALGALTDRMLEELGLRKKVYNPQSTVVHSDAGHMLVNQMRTGSLDACIVYRSNAMSNPQNLEHMELLSIDLPQAIATQPFAISKNAEHKHLMERLFEAVTTAQNQSNFKSLGFEWILPPTSNDLP